MSFVLNSPLEHRYLQLRDLSDEESIIQKWCVWQKSGGFNPFSHGVDGESVKSDVVRFNIRTAREFAAKLFVEDGAIQAKTGHKHVETKTSSNSADQFRHLDEWSASNHESLFFQVSGDRRAGQSGGGVTFLSLDPKQMRRKMQRDLPILFRELTTNQVNIGSSLNEVQGEFHKLLGVVTGKIRSKAECGRLLGGKYCVTGDSVLKMIAIVLRLRTGIPCVVLGDAGCGKSFLVTYLASFLDIPLRVLNVHGGTSVEDILNIVHEANTYVRMRPGSEVLLFLDEINTCNHMGLMSEILCNHSFYGVQLEQDVHVLGAANPYVVFERTCRS